ncbi:hypothetical protein Cgig2_005112 [Carnegiea gigantea]|uniref:Uncharacterized protein n=1 Tax=Carnegiea gigantea TaxID=171969 RepID=A0A9Q1QTB1_9CARY|nr:hypothetical protein Cgig2_005112 [Carnegiea gigantea]
MPGYLRFIPLKSSMSILMIVGLLPRPRRNLTTASLMSHDRDISSALGFYTQTDCPNIACAPSPVTATANHTRSGQPWCTFYGRVGHTQDRCYKRLGITPAGKGRGRGRGPHAIEPTSIGAVSAATAAATVLSIVGPSVPATATAAQPLIPGLSANQVQRLLVNGAYNVDLGAYLYGGKVAVHHIRHGGTHHL